jgi:TPR repeat protein
MNELGLGVRVNLSDAKEYYQRAADLGEPVSQLKLANFITKAQAGGNQGFHSVQSEYQGILSSHS